jgi:glutamate-1-semialdehyde 2,1-aminomutase
VRFASQLDADPRVRARALLPGGYGRSTFMVGDGAPYALRGAGHSVWDDTGRELVDLNNNFASLIHGHAQPEVVEAAVAALRSGSSFGLPSEPELDHAEALLARLPHADLVRYTNSGTEAVMTALRIARAHTGRSRTIMVRRAYHGTSDPVLPAGDERSWRGLPEAVRAEATLLPLNDVDALADAFAREGERTAAVLIDLLPNRSGLIPASRGYVDALAGLCAEHGVLLIADEVISLRLGFHGRAADYDLAPDLTVTGKLIGGGLPVGALAGRAEVMDELNAQRADGLEHGGTFSGNPVTMAAGTVAMRLYDAAAAGRLNGLGTTLREALAARVAGCGWEVRGVGSLLRPWPLELGGEELGTLHRALWWAAYERDVLLNPTGLAALSTPMDAAVVDSLADRLGEAIEAVAGGWRPRGDDTRDAPAPAEA